MHIFSIISLLYSLLFLIKLQFPFLITFFSLFFQNIIFEHIWPNSLRNSFLSSAIQTNDQSFAPLLCFSYYPFQYEILLIPKSILFINFFHSPFPSFILFLQMQLSLVHFWAFYVQQQFFSSLVYLQIFLSFSLSFKPH